ncbi:hypothetical protein [Actinomadura hibisca]|uniref:hypothetical protein n=1 Tax=Actinomadura hibisca TaxID=68565 RepID=UPI000835AC76|nr:hypothetical protein [Actinomadura hibisca]
MDSYFRMQIGLAATGSRWDLYTDPVLDDAARALEALEDVLADHDIRDGFQRRTGDLAGLVLNAVKERCVRANYFTGEEEIDPCALLQVALDFLPDHLDTPLTPLQPPVMADSTAIVAYMVLPRLDTTPPLGEDGRQPLVVTLGRPDRAAAAAAASSGTGGWYGGYEPGPWEWVLGHKVPHGTWTATFHGTGVVAPEPCAETAARLSPIIAQVLSGETVLPR